jgi:integrase
LRLKLTQKLKETDTSSVTFWLRKAAQSPRTERVYRYYLQDYARKTGLDPEATVSEWQSVRYDYAQRERFLDKHSDLIERFAVGELSKLTPLSRATELAGILSFYQHNKIPVEPDIQERVYVVNHNRAIQKEEIRRILAHATLRDKCFFLTMLESGLRPQTLVMVRYKHIKTDFEANRVPMLIELDPTMLKDNVSRRFTFIGHDAFETLKEYLAPRVKLGVPDDEVIFTPVHKGNQKGAYLSPSLFSTVFGEIVKKLGLSEKKEGRFRRELNLYTLRKYFRNNIKVSDSAFREFWMGHTLGVDRNYFEASLEDPKTVEKHRQEYAAGYPFLQVGAENPSGILKEMEKLGKQNTELMDKVAELEHFKNGIEDLIQKTMKHERELWEKQWMDKREMEREEAENKLQAEVAKQLEKEGSKKADEEMKKLKKLKKQKKSEGMR